MHHPPTSPAQLKAFLLGTLSPAEHDSLEERLLADDELFDELCALDDDLIDALRRGALSPDESHRLKRRLHATRHGRRRLALDRFLAIEATRRWTPRPFYRAFLDWIRDAPIAPALVAQAALLAVVAGPLAWHNMQLSDQLATVASTPHATDTGEPSTESAPGLLSPVELTFDLPASSRSAAPRLALDSTIERIRLRVPLPPDTAADTVLTARLVAERETWSTDDVRVLDDALGLCADIVIEATALGSGLHSLIIEHDKDTPDRQLVGQFSFSIAVDETTLPDS